jgi:hypothetical protein
VAYDLNWYDDPANTLLAGNESFALRGRLRWPPLFANAARRFAMVPIEPSVRRIGCAVTIAAFLLCPEISRADESGISFWLPGQYASLAATPQTPGWALGAVYYHTSIAASGNAAAAREIQVGRLSPTVNVNLNLNLKGQADFVVLSPSYTFATPVLGGQLAVSVASWYGPSSASIAGTLTAAVGPIVATRSGSLQDSLTSYGDVIPTATLRWNQGVNNVMTYVTGDIPAGDYDSMRLANVGIGHGAVDAGGGYTYLNPATGNEFSGVAGFTYNFKNPETQYRSGIDFHFDWGASHFLSKQLFVGIAGYAFQQVTDDSGQSPQLGGFRSRVLGVGPQIGYIFPLGDMQGFLGLRGYGEFDASNRPSGWNTWLTFAISPAEPTAVTPTRHLVTK